MFIVNHYQKEIAQLPSLSDHEYMVMQIWLLKNTFHHEISSIKNTQHEFVAFTKRFAAEFGGSELTLGKTAVGLPGVSIQDYTAIHDQEQRIINNHEFQDSIYLFRKNKEVINYVMRKRPLINPATHNCVGIFINISRVNPGIFRKLLISKLLPTTKTNSTIINYELTEQQQQIFFCLLLGFQSRKEIAAILSNLTKSEYNETRIKNSLQALYNKFDCHTPGQLLDLISASPIQVELPAVLPTGNYIVGTESTNLEPQK